MITLDTKGGNVFTSASSVTITNYSTTNPNEIILLFSNVFASGGYDAIASISGGGLTWVKVKPASDAAVTTGTGSIVEEVWAAFATSVITNQTITITYSGVNDRGAVACGSFNGIRTTGSSVESAIAQVKSTSGTANPNYAPSFTGRSKNGLVVYGLGTLVTGTVTPTSATSQQSESVGSGTSSTQLLLITRNSANQRDDTGLVSGSISPNTVFTAGMIELISADAGMVFKGEIGNTVSAGTGSSTTVPIGGSNYMYEVPIGTTIVVEIGFGATTQNATVTDSRGNVYTRVNSQNFASSRIEVWHCQSTTTKLNNGDTINISWTGGATGYAIEALAMYGLITINTVDSGTSATGTGTAVNSGSTQKQQANEIILGFGGQSGDSSPVILTPTNPFVDGMYPHGNVSGVNRGILTTDAAATEIYAYYKYTTSTPPQSINFTGTFGSSESWAGFVVLYKEAGPSASVTPGTGGNVTITGSNPIPGVGGGGVFVVPSSIDTTSPAYANGFDPQATQQDPTSSTSPSFIFNGVEGVTYVYGIYNIDGSGNYTYTIIGTFTINATIKKKRFAYKIYDKNLNYITTWSTDVVADPTFRMVINGGASELVIRLGRTYTQFDEGVSVAVNNRVELWCYDCDAPDGVKVYTGYISIYSPVIDDENQYVDVTVLGFATNLTNYILTDPATTDTTITYSGFDPSNILRDAIDKYHDSGGNFVFYTSSSIQNTNSTVTYQFINSTIQDVINKVIELTPYNWFWFVDANGIINLGMANIAKADHTLTIGRDISYIQSNKRLEGIVNEVAVIGGGLVPLYNLYQRASSISSYGIHHQDIQDYRITDNATADFVAKRKLDQFQTPEYRTIIHVTDNNGENQLQGANIEAFYPGQTIQVINLAPQPILIIQSITYFFDHLEIQASTRLPEIAVDLQSLSTQLQTLGQSQLPAAPTIRSV